MDHSLTDERHARIAEQRAWTRESKRSELVARLNEINFGVKVAADLKSFVLQTSEIAQFSRATEANETTMRELVDELRIGKTEDHVATLRFVTFLRSRCED